MIQLVKSCCFENAVSRGELICFRGALRIDCGVHYVIEMCIK